MLKTSDVKKARNSSIEILRIIAMLMIILSHFSVHGVGSYFSFTELEPCFNKFFLESINLGFLGVDIFMLISGYYNVESKFKAEKLIKLLLQVFFYSAIIYVILCCAGLIDFSFFGAVKAFFPTLFKEYWFFCCYLIIYILSPFINIFIKAASKKQLLSVIIIMWFLWEIVPMISGGDFFNNRYFSDLFVMYFIGAYLRLYPNNIFSKRKVRYIMLFSSLSLLPISVILLNISAHYIPSLTSHYGVLYSRLSIVMIIAACSVFISFLKTDIKENKFINVIASCSFGVYLIHDHSLLRPFIWGSIIQAQKYTYSKVLVLYAVISSVLIFIVCALIDFIRQKTIEKPVNAAVSAICETIRKKAVAFIDKKS